LEDVLRYAQQGYQHVSDPWSFQGCY
jgi:hypothetical protein